MGQSLPFRWYRISPIFPEYRSPQRTIIIICHKQKADEMSCSSSSEGNDKGLHSAGNKRNAKE